MAKLHGVEMYPRPIRGSRPVVWHNASLATDVGSPMRLLVRMLWLAGFQPTEVTEHRVVMVVRDAVMLADECDRLRELLARFDIHLTLPDEEPVIGISGRYETHCGLGLISLVGVTDESLPAEAVGG